jgi:hypothetical protein
MIKALIFSLLFLSIFSIGSCTNHPGLAGYKEVIKISAANNEERAATFESFPVEEQIDIYLFAACCVEPSDLSFSSHLARNGRSKIRSIAERLNTASDQRDKTNLIRVLAEINDDCDCVSQDSHIMDILFKNEGQTNSGEERAGNPTWREIYSNDLKQIKGEGSFGKNPVNKNRP